MGHVRDWIEPLKEKFGLSIVQASVMGGEADKENGLDELLYFLDKSYEGGVIVETGTCFGLSSAILATYAPRVVTFDLSPSHVPGKTPTLNEPYKHMNPNAICKEVWKFLGLEDKIEARYVYKGNGPNVDGLDFTLAYIDGDHSMDGVSKDYESLKSCGKVIFHDHDKMHKTVKRFVNSLKTGNVEVRGKVAFWQGETR